MDAHHDASWHGTHHPVLWKPDNGAGQKENGGYDGSGRLLYLLFVLDVDSRLLQNAFIYVKSKLGLLNATTPLHLQALFHGPAEEEERYMEIDLEAWEELVPHILKLRIMT